MEGRPGSANYPKHVVIKEFCTILVVEKMLTDGRITCFNSVSRPTRLRRLFSFRGSFVSLYFLVGGLGPQVCDKITSWLGTLSII